MLVLDRKLREGFWIDGNIFVKVLDIGRRRVKLGIEAPNHLKIMREELRSRPADDESGERDPPVPEGPVEGEGSFRPVRRRN